MSTPSQEAARRRTFAIVSHPDAGKTTLTEKFLLYSGAVEEAGAVKARKGRRAVTSDWMDLERQRGISITSTVLQFPHRDHVLNLLDTPGHRDFSEDTYRVLTAVDAAIMVLDAAKGIESQTRKLFEVCRQRGTPLITFVNKCDRPGIPPLALLDEIEETLGIHPTPVTWPVDEQGVLVGVADRRTGGFIRFGRTARGATESPEESLDLTAGSAAAEELGLLGAVGADLDVASFLDGTTSPVFFGSALWNFGVRLLLDAVVDLAPPPRPKADVEGAGRPLDAPFSGFVFKLQANMDPDHRDTIAFVRVCSGTFERGMPVVHGPTGRQLTTRYANQIFGQERATMDTAHPGDVIGLVNAGGVRIGDTIHAGQPVTFPRVPTFPPEHFRVARNRDSGRYKQFRRGLAQLEEEGVIQVLRDPDLGDQAPVLGAVGPMQFEVAVHRLETEFGASVQMEESRHNIARIADRDTVSALAGERDVRFLTRSDGVVLAMFANPYQLERLERDRPEVRLEPIVGA